jgi:hypothetical protein
VQQDVVVVNLRNLVFPLVFDRLLERIYCGQLGIFVLVQLPKYESRGYYSFLFIFIFLQNDEPNVFLQLFLVCRKHLDQN